MRCLNAPVAVRIITRTMPALVTGAAGGSAITAKAVIGACVGPARMRPRHTVPIASKHNARPITMLRGITNDNKKGKVIIMRKDQDGTIKSVMINVMDRQGMIGQKIVKAFQSTEHPCSSYGQPIWVEAKTHEPIDDWSIVKVYDR